MSKNNKMDSLLEEIQNLKTENSYLYKENKQLIKQGSSFGLIWEDRPDSKVLELENHIPVLKERKEKELILDINKATHTLIKGDNFQGLTALLTDYENKIDLIYIDPPYNTGNSDFIYNDKYISDTDSFRHSSWLSFMNSRLILAKQCLSDDGLIFLSIDDNEFAHLKLLMDKIFGERNFVANLIWRKTGQQQNNGNNFAKVTEYILVYSNNEINNVISKEAIEDRKGLDAYKNEDSRGVFRANPIQDKSLGKHSYEVINPHTNQKIHSDYWRQSEEKFYELLKKDMIFWGKSNNALPQTKLYLKDNKGALRNTLIDDNFIDNSYNEESNALMKQLFEDTNIFQYTKPVSLIKKIISMYKHKDLNYTVLDFFAGSGTTGQAVAELNAEDGGNRKCILITDSGKFDSETNSNGVDIAEYVTYERMKKILTGQKWADGKERLSLNQNLRMFEIRKIKTFYEKEIVDYEDDGSPIFSESRSPKAKETILQEISEYLDEEDTSKLERIYYHWNNQRKGF